MSFGGINWFWLLVGAALGWFVLPRLLALTARS